MEKKLFLAGVLSLSLLASGLISPASADAASKNKSVIPAEVLEKVKQKEMESKQELPKITAWEEGLNGEIKLVTPLSERVEEASDGISMNAVPNDGYKYSFSYYSVSNPQRKWTYKSAGTVRVSNTRSVPADLTYTQQESTSTNWSVTTNISGNATIKASFLGKVGASVGLTVDYTKAWTEGKSYGVSTSVPARSVAYLTAYAVGVNDSGRLVYKKYTSSGTLVGYYYESAGGTGISKTDANIELTDTDPL